MDGTPQHKGTGVFFPACFQDTINDIQPTASSSAPAPGCGLLFSKDKQHAISSQWPQAVEGPAAATAARPAVTPLGGQQAAVNSCAVAGPCIEPHSNANPNMILQLQDIQTMAHRASSNSWSLMLQAARSDSGDSSNNSDSSSSCCSTAFGADAGLWGAASTTAQPRQPPGSRSSQQRHVLVPAPSTSDGLTVSGVDVWLDEHGSMWFDVQPDSLPLQAESSTLSLSWASNDNLILLPSLPLDGSPGLSPVTSNATHGHQGQEPRPRRSSLLVLQPPLSPYASGLCEPASHTCAPCLATGGWQEQGWSSPLVGSWALPSQLLGAQGSGGPVPPPPPSLSLLEQQLLLAQGTGMAPGMPALDPLPPSAELLTASSAGLVLPIGHHLLHPTLPLEVPAEVAAMPAVGPASLPAAAQSKLQQLATIEEMKQALERELLEMLRG